MQIQDEARDNRFMLMHDRSEYDSTIPLLNHHLYVQTPGFTDPVKVLFAVGSTTLIHSHKLGLTDGFSELASLPDGLYTFTLSVAPNDQVYQVIYYFRTVNLDAKLCRLMLQSAVHGNQLIVDGSGHPQQIKEERILIRCMNLLKAIQSKTITGDKDYTNLVQQYEEIERLITYITETHV